VTVVVAAGRGPQLPATTARHGHGLPGAAGAQPQTVERPAERALSPAARAQRRDHGSGAGTDQGVDETQHAGQPRGGSLPGKQSRTVYHLLGYPPLPGRQRGRLANSGNDRFRPQGGLELGEQPEQRTDLLREQRSVDPLGHPFTR
jgi:hypothetical protein